MCTNLLWERTKEILSFLCEGKYFFCGGPLKKDDPSHVFTPADRQIWTFSPAPLSFHLCRKLFFSSFLFFFSLSQHFSFVSLLCASLLRQCIKLLIRYRKQDGLQYGDPLRGTFGTTPTCALVGLRESQILLRPFSRPFTALPVLVGLGEGKPETKTKNEPPEIFALIIWHSLTLEYGNFLSQRAMALLKRKSKIFLIIFFKDF